MAILIGIVNLQRVIQVVFGNIVDMRNHMNCHPGMNRTHIAGFHIAILLLEVLYCLKSIYSSKGNNSYHEE